MSSPSAIITENRNHNRPVYHPVVQQEQFEIEVVEAVSPFNTLSDSATLKQPGFFTKLLVTFLCAVIICFCLYNLFW